MILLVTDLVLQRSCSGHAAVGENFLHESTQAACLAHWQPRIFPTDACLTFFCNEHHAMKCRQDLTMGWAMTEAAVAQAVARPEQT